MRLQGRRGVLGRTAAPQSLDQPVRRDHAVRLEEEHRQDYPLLRAAELDRLGPDQDLERAENTEIEGQEREATTLLRRCQPPVRPVSAS